MKKYYALIFLLAVCLGSFAQGKKKNPALNPKQNKKNDFLDKQWWLGFKGGFNLSQAVSQKQYTILTPTNYDASLNNKTYDSYNVPGIVATVEASFYYKSFYFSFQPSYRSSFFTYSNQLQWTNPENAAEMLVQNYHHEQKVEFADLPLLVKYDITGSRLRPYVQVGIYYSLLINAIKTVTVTGTDFASGGTNPLNSDPVIVGTKDLFTNYWGLIGGAGVTYQLGNVRLVLDASYRYGMSNIVNAKNRFSNDRLSGIGDAQDDLKLHNIMVTAGVLFPMRFLSTDFKSNDR